MSFSLKIDFSGLLHYVANENPSDVSPLCRFCILLPNAPKHSANLVALGGRLGNTGKDGLILERRKRVALVWQASQPVAASETILPDFESVVVGDTSSGSLVGAIPLEKMINFEDKNLEVVSSTPPADRIRTQFLIGPGGSFSLPSEERPAEVELPAVAASGEQPTRLKIVESISMEVKGLERASVVVFPLRNEIKAISVHQIVPDNGVAHLALSHTCPPLKEKRKVGDEDADFRFHYLLLSRSPKGAALKAMPAPKIMKFYVPLDLGNIEPVQLDSQVKERRAAHQVKTDVNLQFTQTGCNCASARGLARPFNLENFMSAALKQSS